MMPIVETAERTQVSRWTRNRRSIDLLSCQPIAKSIVDVLDQHPKPRPVTARSRQHGPDDDFSSLGWIGELRLIPLSENVFIELFIRRAHFDASTHIKSFNMNANAFSGP
jgi:hypothetical protein